MYIRDVVTPDTTYEEEEQYRFQVKVRSTLNTFSSHYFSEFSQFIFTDYYSVHKSSLIYNPLT